MILTIDNSMSRLEGYTSRQYAELRKLLSYKASEQAAYFSGASWRSNVRYLMDRRGSFPTGLLYLVEKWAKKLPNKITVRDVRKPPQKLLKPLNYPCLRVTPYPEQLEASKAFLGANGRGIVVAPTGVGKSVIVALMIYELQVPTLVVVPSLELKHQLTVSLKEAFGADRVGSLKEKRTVSVENVDALDPRKPLEDYHSVIIDEYHHSAAPTYRALNQKAWNGVYYRGGTTATPFRSQENERLLLESILSKVVYRVEYQDAVTKGYIVPMEAYYYDLPKREVEGYTWAQVYSELIVNNEQRNALIAGLLEKLNDQQRSVLCLVKEVKHGENIKAFHDRYFAHASDDYCREMIQVFNSGKLPVLIGTTGVLGEGVDTKPAEYIIIAGLGKSKNAFMQQCGRAFRRYGGKESCKVILFRDPSHKWTLTHFRAQCKFLREEYGIIPVKLEAGET